MMARGDTDNSGTRAGHVTPTFAVLFKTHDWNEFIERQLERLRCVVADDHIFIVFDNTISKKQPRTDLKILYINVEMAEKIGLLIFPENGVFWYNNDYALYIFSQAYPEFDYLVSCEYDCVVRCDIADMVRTAHDEGLEFIGDSIRTPAETWHWKPSIDPHYPAGLQFAGRFTCFSIISQRFSSELLMKRLALSASLRDSAGNANENGIPLWPFCEGLIGAELSLNNIANAGLTRFGPSTHYDWAPPHHERSLNDIDSSFIHPLLDEERFIYSIINKVGWKLEDIISIDSPMHAWFANIRFTIAIPVLIRLSIRNRERRGLLNVAVYAGRRIINRLRMHLNSAWT